MELKLIVLAGAKQGLEIPLKKDKFFIGRAKDCALRAGSEAISRRHCVIVRDNGRWTARDLGSRNGTFVNDNRITEEVTLSPGDELRVGPLIFRIATAADAATTPSAAPAAEAKSRKQPPVKSVADVAQRTINNADPGATEDDVSRWLLGVADPERDATLKETRTLRLEETTLSRPATLPESSADADDAEEVLSSADDKPNGADDSSMRTDAAEKSGRWSFFRRSKGGIAKKKPGKLPPRPDAQTKDSREAAADILREMTRRR
jgi:pSer/pThr/pTyr-binding forkhead associated (FHA) protein